MRFLLLGGTGQVGRELRSLSGLNVDVVAPSRADLDLQDPQSITRIFDAAPSHFDTHMHRVAIYTVWYNYVKQHDPPVHHFRCGHARARLGGAMPTDLLGPPGRCSGCWPHDGEVDGGAVAISF